MLSTVRRKLVALVAFSAIAALGLIPLLYVFMHRQLTDEVNERVPEAIHGFDQELADDLRDLDVTASALSLFPSTAAALAAHDASALERLAAPFRTAYPDLDLVFYDASGALVAQVGCERADPRLPTPLRDRHELLPHGCEAGGVLSVAMARAVGEAGTLVVCLPLDAAWFQNVQRKVGGELSLAVTRGEGATATVATVGFPADMRQKARSAVAMEVTQGHTWALSSFSPPALADAEFSGQTLTFTAALDVSDIVTIVRTNLLAAFAVLLLATLLAVALGWRLASRMVMALDRVNRAMKRLEQQDYVPVDVLRTGDELEDLALGFNAMVVGLQERDKLRTTMGKYMTEAVVAHLMSGEVELGGKTLEVSVLFCDLRGFTSFSEKRGAHEIVGLLNEYFSEMVDCVMAEGGVVDKYIGDCLMAVFGAPVSRPDDAIRSVRAALAMRTSLARLNERFAARGVPPLRFGIGIHTGEVVAGNIGSARRMEYTVIGDAVNLASRLESQTKEQGTDLLISEATWHRAGADLEGTPAGEVVVKGRQQPVRIYTVQGPKLTAPAARASGDGRP
jgi:adenylate cyclase